LSILSDGISTYLKPTGAVGRCLSVRYDGCAKVAFCQLATGLAYRMSNLAFPVPGHLAGNLPTPFSLVARLAGNEFTSHHSFWRQQLNVDVHQTCPPIDIVKGFRLYSFQLPDTMCPALLFIVTTSPCQDWVICAPAAFLGCGSRFSGSLSGIEP